jgi:hypothetical protein
MGPSQRSAPVLPETAMAEAARPTAMLPPQAASRSFLYVTNWRSGYVSVLTYPQGVPVGSIGGFSQPEGECVDAASDVFVADRLHHQVQEFAHGGLTPQKKLAYPGAEPLACSVDPLTGNLAVTNGSRSKTQSSVIAVFPQSGGNPQTYSMQGFNAQYCGYDNQSNLYIDGFGIGKHTFAFAELPKGGSSIVRVSLNKTIHYPGSVQWDGKHLMVSDEFPPAVYRFTFTQSGGMAVGHATTFGNLYEVGQLWVHAGNIVGTDGDVVYLWNYPSGGDVRKTYTGFSNAFGAVISPAR